MHWATRLKIMKSLWQTYEAVSTSWIDDNKTGEMRLTSAYVKKRKGEES